MLKRLLGFSMSTWVGAILTFALLPLASYIYPQEELGVINYYYSVINIVFTVILLGLDQGYIRFFPEIKDKKSKRSLFFINIVGTLIVTAIVILLCFPFREKISVWLMGSNDDGLLLFVFLHLAGLIITRYYSVLYRVEGILWKYTVVAIINTILLKVVYLFGSMADRTAYTAIVATAIISFFMGTVLLLFGRKACLIRMNNSDHILLRKELRYSLPIVPSMLMAVVNNNIPQIMIRNFAGFEYVAVFSIGVTLASSITILHNGANTFLEPYIFQNYQNEKKRISKLLDIFVRVAFFLAIAVILFEDLFFIVFNKTYMEATHFLPLLIASALWYAIGDFYNIGVKIQKKTQENLKIYLCGVLTNIILCLLLIRPFGNMGAAIAAAGASLVMCVWKIKTGQRYFPIMKSPAAFVQGSVLLLVAVVSNELLWGTWIRHAVVLGILLFACYQLRIFRYLYQYIVHKKKRL